MVVRARVQGRRIVFRSPRVEEVFFSQTEGKDLLIETDDAPSGEMRRYFEGAVVPAFFWLHPKAGWRSFKDARDAIKYEFLPAWGKDRLGNRIQFGLSTKDLSKRKWTEFLDKVTSYLRENFDEILDPEEYKRWRDSAPAPGDIYPQHARLKAQWESLQG